MNHQSFIRRGQVGVSLIEVLITLFVLLVGLLGVAGLSLQSQRAAMESFQRSQAQFLLQDMVSRINANRGAAECYAFSSATGGPAYVGTGATAPTACTTGTGTLYTRAIADIAAWHSLLQGSTVSASGSNVGAMIGARGCVTKLATNRYQVSVVWQGLNATSAPSAGLTCGQNLYGNETLRRIVSLPVQIADLKAP